MQGTSPQPLLDRLERIRANKERPSKFATIAPIPMSPFVRAAREKRLAPKTFVAGAFVPSGSDVTA